MDSNPITAMSTTITKSRKRLPANKKAIGSQLKTPERVRTARIIRDLREEYGVSQVTIVRLSGYSPRSIISWSKGTRATRPAEIKFTELGRLFKALADLTQSRGEVKEWLQTPNEAFEGSTPLQVIERGESDRIWRMIYFLRSGEPS